jgi:uncharacterized cofD-like protein
MHQHLNVVVIGGGSGQSTILRGLKLIEDIHLTAIVTVADDGGSTGRLRKSYHIPAMGDIRSVMIALAEEEGLLSTLMSYRFEDAKSQYDNELAGHNLGNLILTALTQKTGSFMEAVESISKVLNVKGDIVPSTHQVVTLLAKMEDGTIVKGESNIPKARHKITDVYYDVPVSASKEAIHAIEKADVIILGIGSLYTSLCCNLIIKEISKALEKSKAYKIYVSNAMTQSGETENYSMEDHVEALRKHAKFKLDAVLWAKDRIPEDVLVRYQKENAEAVKQSQSKHDYVLFSEKLLNFDSGRVRHDPQLIKKFFEKLFRKLKS